jgi:hypothetical protein
VVARSLVVSRGVCITSVYVVFRVLSLSACFGGMIVHFAVCTFVHLASVSSSTFLSAMATISATGLCGCYGGRFSKILG